MNAFQIYEQASAAHSPWGIGIRIKALTWNVCWALFCRWTPKPLNRWRLVWLRLFGATLHGVPFVHASAQVMRPWNLTMHERSCIGEGAVAYCLDRIVLYSDCTIAQGVYLCTGTHDFNDPTTPLKTAPVMIGANAFVGLRAIVLPGVDIGTGTLVGAGSVVTRDTKAWSIYAGNPARMIGVRRQTTET